MKYDIITILGPTAVGKTKLAARLAAEFNGEIISADSRQVYKGMDIGTGKDISDYYVNGQKINYHLIDVIDPADEFNLFLFMKYFRDSYHSVKEKGKIPFLTGGTGLYLHSVLKGYDISKVKFSVERKNELRKKDLNELTEYLKKTKPGLHNTTDLLDKERVITAILIAENESEDETISFSLNSLNIGIYEERETIKKRITDRLKKRFEEGMIDEVKELVNRGVTYDKLNFFGLEYRYIGLYLQGKLNYNDMYQKLNSAIHKFAKRQMTWFRKMEKEGIKINWLKGPDYGDGVQIINEKFYARKN